MKSVRPRQRGLTLLELLVALALGLAVSLAGAVLLAGAHASWSAHADAAELDDGGRHALALVGNAVRQAAFVDWEGGAAPAPGAPPRLAGLDNHTLGRTSAGLDAAQPDAVGASDVLALRFPGAGAAPGGDGSVLDCAGFAVHAAEEGWSIFYVARNGDGVAELRCKYRGAGGWSADAIVAGVDGFQVLYGLDTDTSPDGAPNRYVNARTLAALDAALPYADAATRNAHSWWKRVASVQVALLLHGRRPAAAAPPPTPVDLFGADYSLAQGEHDPGARLASNPGADAPPRRLFSAVFAVGAPSVDTP